MEITSLLEKLDLPVEIATAENPLEAFEAAFKVKYTSKEMILKDPLVDARIKSLVGKAMGSATTKLQSISGLSKSEINDMSIEDLIDKIGEKHTTEITTLTEAATKGNDEKLTSLTEELEKTKKAANKYKTDLEQISTTYKQDQEKWSGELKNYKIKTLLNGELSKVTFIDNIKALEKEGYDSTISRKYKFDLDETGEKLVVMDDKGEPIQNPKKVGSYFAPGEVLTLEALNNGILKQNNASATTKPAATFQAAKPAQVEGRKLSEAAVKTAEMQKS